MCYRNTPLQHSTWIIYTYNIQPGALISCTVYCLELVQHAACDMRCAFALVACCSFLFSMYMVSLGDVLVWAQMGVIEREREVCCISGAV